MGFRLRKSINLGGGARINLSKSGIGGSIGTKGFRVTQTAKGTIRKTTSIPGTGISWIEETGKGNKKSGNMSSQGMDGDNNKPKGCGTGCLTIIIFIFLIGAMSTCFSK